MISLIFWLSQDDFQFFSFWKRGHPILHLRFRGIIIQGQWVKFQRTNHHCWLRNRRDGTREGRIPPGRQTALEGDQKSWFIKVKAAEKLGQPSGWFSLCSRWNSVDLLTSAQHSISGQCCKNKAKWHQSTSLFLSPKKPDAYNRSRSLKLRRMQLPSDVFIRLEEDANFLPIFNAKQICKVFKTCVCVCVCVEGGGETSFPSP